VFYTIEEAAFNKIAGVCLCFQGVVNTTYARDNYWLCSVNLQQRIDAASFSSLWEMRDCVANLHGIAQKKQHGKPGAGALVRPFEFLKFAIAEYWGPVPFLGTAADKREVWHQLRGVQEK